MKDDIDQNTPPNAFVLVVMESNADWPAEIDAYELGCAVLKQELNESYTELVRRTKDSVGSVEEAGGFVRTAILTCGDGRAAAIFAGRAAMSHVLLQAMCRTGAELRILAPAGTPASSRQRFVALAGELTAELTGNVAAVHLRFPDKTTHGGSGAARERHGRHESRLHTRERRLPAHWS
jgi:hypothetical protein